MTSQLRKISGVPTRSLAAACIIAPTNEFRPQLNGVQIMLRDNLVHIRAIDGAVGFADVSPAAESVEAQITIPTATAKLLAKEKLTRLNFEECDGGKWLCEGHLFTPVPELFPDMDRVLLPRQHSVIPAIDAPQYDAELLFRAQKAMRVATGKRNAYFRVQYTEPAMMFRESADRPCCVVMPLRPAAAFKSN